jgi:hypothetical protein
MLPFPADWLPSLNLFQTTKYWTTRTLYTLFPKWILVIQTINCITSWLGLSSSHGTIQTTLCSTQGQFYEYLDRLCPS